LGAGHIKRFRRSSVVHGQDRDESRLATVDVNGNTCLWNVATRTLAATLPNPGPGFAMDDVAFSPDGRTLAVVDQGGGTYLWNVATRTLAATLTSPATVSTPGSAPSADVAAFSPDGRTLATADDDDGNTYLWNLSTRTRSATMHDPGGNAVNDVAFSPDGRTLATTDINGNTYLWNVATRALTATFASTGSSYGGSAIDTIAFSPDSRALATGDQDGGILYVWNLATGKRAATFQDPDNGGVSDSGSSGVITSILAVAFSPDGRSLAASDVFGHIDLWDMSWLDS
jgi:WD40 repeat protein